MSGEAIIMSLNALLLLGILLLLICWRNNHMKSLQAVAKEVIDEVVGQELPETDDAPLKEAMKKVALQSRDQVIKVRNETATATAEKVTAVSEEVPLKKQKKGNKKKKDK